MNVLNWFAIIFLLVGCGKRHSAQKDPFLEKTVDLEKKLSDTPKHSDKKQESKIIDNSKLDLQPIVIRKNREEIEKEIPEKYDDVGDFYKTKNIPGVSDFKEIKITSPKNSNGASSSNQKDKKNDNSEKNSSAKTTVSELIIQTGRLKLSRVFQHYDVSKNELEVSGDITFNNQTPVKFVLSGKFDDTVIFLEVPDKKSSLKKIFKGKAVCYDGEEASNSYSSSDTSDSEESAVANCDQLVIFFYYEYKNSNNKVTIYTGHLISKNFIRSEIDKIFKMDQQQQNDSGNPDSGAELPRKDLEVEIPSSDPDHAANNLKQDNSKQPKQPNQDNSTNDKSNKKGKENKDNTGNTDKKDKKSSPAKENSSQSPKKSEESETPEKSPAPKSSGQTPPETGVNTKNPSVTGTQVPLEVGISPGEDQLSDYDIQKKNGTLENSEGVYEELPYYNFEPDLDDISKLFVEASGPIEEYKQKIKKSYKKLVKLPKLSGDEGSSNASDNVKKEDKDKDKNDVANNSQDSSKEGNSNKNKSGNTLDSTLPVSSDGPTPIEPSNGDEMNPEKRPIDQAWGSPNAGKKIKNTGKRIYLTNSSSLLEAWQKIGSQLSFNVRSPKDKQHYGTYDLVDLIVNIGEWVKENVSDLKFQVGDISGKNGGPIGHRSHKTGMDADISYLTRNPKLIFNRIDTYSGRDTHPDFLAAKQWELFKAAFEMAPIEVIYVNRKIKNEMCRQALKVGDLKSKTDKTSRAAEILTHLIVLRSNKYGDSQHGNHWHVRMDCKALNSLKLQTKCLPYPQAFVGPECEKISYK